MASEPVRPEVAVVMPTYRHAAVLGAAMDSVLAQTFSAWELVVVDDGSPDTTLDIARRRGDPRIQVVAREHLGLKGLWEAYRTALDRTSAPLIAILEGDDRWPPDKLARQVPDFDDPEVVLSYGAGRLIDDCGCEYGLVVPSFPPAARTNRPIGSILPSLLAVNPILSPTVVVRRAAIEAIGGFWQPDGVPYLDHPTWLRLATAGAFAYHEDPVGSWRRHAAQWTTRASQAEPGDQPELAYVGPFAEQHAELIERFAPGWQPADMARGHADRARLNRWRLALLSGDRAAIARVLRELLRSGRPQLTGLALLGLTMRAAGSDLEWIWRRRRRVSWPSRHHLRRHPCAGDHSIGGQG